ncbi:g1/s-specific cyclin-e [Anaeramoeba ignava]|uniref:G1/s-specific cyclin-e n=1 Tax=Anaeramoeba ignava TaxID=1746090 RepID=A0A9Q0LS33_ANAIG|nr:g1/s-specific cyclin-e [Anaeramoeba ignava]
MLSYNRSDIDNTFLFNVKMPLSQQINYPYHKPLIRNKQTAFGSKKSSIKQGGKEEEEERLEIKNNNTIQNNKEGGYIYRNSYGNSYDYDYDCNYNYNYNYRNGNQDIRSQNQRINVNEPIQADCFTYPSHSSVYNSHDSLNYAYNLNQFFVFPFVDKPYNSTQKSTDFNFLQNCKENQLTMLQPNYLSFPGFVSDKNNSANFMVEGKQMANSYPNGRIWYGSNSLDLEEQERRIRNEKMKIDQEMKMKKNGKMIVNNKMTVNNNMTSNNNMALNNNMIVNNKLVLNDRINMNHKMALNRKITQSNYILDNSLSPDSDSHSHPNSDPDFDNLPRVNSIFMSHVSFPSKSKFPPPDFQSQMTSCNRNPTHFPKYTFDSYHLNINRHVTSPKNTYSPLSSCYDTLAQEQPSDVIEANSTESELFQQLRFTMFDTEAKFQADPNYLYRLQLNEMSRVTTLETISRISCQFDLKMETFLLAVNIYDRYLSTFQKIGSKQFQLLLIATTSLVIASKLEEVYPISIVTICKNFKQKFQKEDVIQMEIEILKKLNYSLLAITANTWISLYLFYSCWIWESIQFPKHYVKKGSFDLFIQYSQFHPKKHHLDQVLSFFCTSKSQNQNLCTKKLLHIIKFPVDLYHDLMQLIHLAILDPFSLNFYPSLLAASALSLYFSYDAVKKITNYSKRELYQCREWLKIFISFPSRSHRNDDFVTSQYNNQTNSNFNQSRNQSQNFNYENNSFLLHYHSPFAESFVKNLIYKRRIPNSYQNEFSQKFNSFQSQFF